MTIIKNYQDLLINANKRKMIVVLNESDFNEAMSDYKNGQFLLDESICYIINPSKDDIQKSPILYKMDELNQLKSGNILIQTNEPEDYLNFDESIKKSIFTKMTSFNRLCQFLGAKEVSFQISENTKNSTNTQAELEVNITKPICDIKAQSKTNFIDEINQAMQSETTFNDSNKKDISQAKLLMNTKIFANDPAIINFFNLSINDNNKLTEQSVKFNLAENISKEISILAKIDIPIFEKTIGSANFEIIKEISKTLSVKYTVKF